MEKDLIKILNDNEISIKGNSSYVCIDSKGISFMRIRDVMLKEGNVDYENNDDKYFIGRIMVKGTEAALVVRLLYESIEIFAFAREGLLNRNVANKAIDYFRRAIENEY